MKSRNSEIEGVRFFLSATVIQVHHVSAHWRGGHLKGPWLAVNGFFVLSAFFAVTSLASSWKRWKTRKVTVSNTLRGASKPFDEVAVVIKASSGGSPNRALLPKSYGNAEQSYNHNVMTFYQERCTRPIGTRFLCQYIEFLIKRIPPFIWITWAFVIMFTPYDTMPLMRRMFDPTAFPLTNYWGLGLRGDGKHRNYYLPNPVFWYMCSLTLFLICAPILFQVLNMVKRFSRRSSIKGSALFLVPLAVCVLDYYAVRALIFPDLMTSINHEPAGHVLQHSPLAYGGKFATAMVAASLWTEVEQIPQWLNSVPVIDLLVVAQALWFHLLETHPWIEARWTLFYISAFTPGHCLIVWAILRGLGCRSFLRQALGSRYIRRISHGCSLFVFLIHVPLHREWLQGRAWESTGFVLGTLCSYIMALHMQDGQTELLAHYNRFTDKILQALDRSL
eukprot:Blabericola_migrator_1__2849@NODE_1816_length_3743_cov_264_731230_g1166_i0_p1_GENE_NODE_1816_length_3743_cov_264_731230_g1166_i0NODE_1816_length_3743_cov_264_731230_g1166_i0_p1_ORF_typecomplete_len448_score41_43Acyl_transf_3/PF01757_22/0_019Acyl_transf_3/PF01757_22/7_2e06DUF2189/PF09955_9/0_12DUF2189/PF09955_9/4_6e03DUF2189/PF09955_9/3_1e03_NODE_1816_length_3743_cov_264_731230_g1166_i021023445